MAANISCTFTCFPKLPLELQKMVWEEAALALPTLGIQRFTAKIVLTQPNAGTGRDPLLCFTPHADFIHTTSGYRSLLRACRESHKAAQRQIKCLLPIHYLTTDATGSLVPRQASVPFDPSGHFCIGGLASAFEGVKERTEYDALHQPGVDFIIAQIHKLQGLEETTTSPIKNLLIALDPAQCGRHAYSYLRRWDERGLELLASRMPNLKTASLLGEAIVNRRHHLDQRDFNRMHKSVNVVPKSERAQGEKSVPWRTLWENWRRQQPLYYAIARNKIDEIVRRSSQNSKESALVDDAAIAATRRALELNLIAVME